MDTIHPPPIIFCIGSPAFKSIALGTIQVSVESETIRAAVNILDNGKMLLTNNSSISFIAPE